MTESQSWFPKSHIFLLGDMRNVGYVTTESLSHFFAIARCGSLFSEISEPSIHPLAHVLAAGIPFPSHLFHLPELLDGVFVIDTLSIFMRQEGEISSRWANRTV